MNVLQRIYLAIMLWGMLGILMIAIGSKIAQNANFVLWSCFMAAVGTICFIAAKQED